VIMANNYCRIAEVKAMLADTQWSTSYDAILTSLVKRASRFIDLAVKKWPGYFAANADETRYFQGSGKLSLWVDEICASPTSVAVAETGDIVTPTYTAWAATDYILWPYNAIAMGEPYTRLDIDVLNGNKAIWYRYPKSVRIIGKFGYTTTAGTPEPIVQATIVQTVRWFKRGQQAFQDVGAIKDLGQLKYVQDLDPDIKQTIFTKYRGVTV